MRYSGAENVYQEDLLLLEQINAFDGMIADMMLGLLLSLLSLTVNRHHAEREMAETLHESKLKQVLVGAL